MDVRYLWRGLAALEISLAPSLAAAMVVTSAAQRTRGSDGRWSSLSLWKKLQPGVTQRTISYNRLSTCDDCNGTGLGEGGKIEDCPRCHGTGTMSSVHLPVR